MKKLLLFCLFIVFTSCLKEPLKTLETNNSEYKIHLLFEVDGCKVYKFYDASNVRYFTTCNGSVSFKTSEKHPKEIEIQTVRK
jgi:hypothetical protein